MNEKHHQMEHMEHMEHTAGHEGTDHSAMEQGDHGSSGGGHMAHMGDLKRKFFISLLLAVPVMLLSPLMGIELPFRISFPGSQWVVLILSTALYFYGGMPFLQGARAELKEKAPAMMTLISLGITVAYFYSLYAFYMNHFMHDAHVMDFFWELATLIVIMLLGHWIEMRAVAGAGDALRQMAKLLPGSAIVRMSDGSYAEVPLDQLDAGQVVMVKPGAKVPADGVVEEGQTSVNESMVTGEARQVPKTVGDRVIGGSVNGNGSIVVRVTATGKTGYLAQVTQLVSSAQQDKSRAEALSDRVARLLFYVALAAGVLALIAWYLISGDLNTALERMVTVLVIACPHALGLAVPLVVARSTSLGAQNGLLVRSRVALEKARNVDVVVMDKTGTLTEGNFKVAEVVTLSDKFSEDDVLSNMAALEQNSNHPLAAGVMKEARAREIAIPAASDVENLPGVGLRGTLADGREAAIVGPSYLDQKQIAYNRETFASLSGRGLSVSYLLIDANPVGIIAQGDEIKPEAERTIKALKARGITPVMLTGDNEATALKVANTLGIEEVRAGLLPEGKESVVREYRDKGMTVMMVGDGVNDAPSLARADIGVAIGTGTDVAIDSADVILVKSDPADILHFLSLARNTSSKIVQNLWWGAGYNIIAIPLAAGVLAPFGVLLGPAAGAVLMSLSTVIVAINAITLRK